VASRWRRLRRLRRPQIALVALIAAVGIGYAINAARDDHHGGLRDGTVALSALPSQVTDTVHLVQSRGPFPYRQDGEIFSNAEGHLPAEPRGYYHEYTVITPQSRDRGARRIITGQHGEFFYTSDHYDSFQRVDVMR
jgi:ribonuclease T1